MIEYNIGDVFEYDIGDIFEYDDGNKVTLKVIKVKNCLGCYFLCNDCSTFKCNGRNVAYKQIFIAKDGKEFYSKKDLVNYEKESFIVNNYKLTLLVDLYDFNKDFLLLKDIIRDINISVYSCKIKEKQELIDIISYLGGNSNPISDDDFESLKNSEDNIIYIIHFTKTNIILGFNKQELERNFSNIKNSIDIIMNKILLQG